MNTPVSSELAKLLKEKGFDEVTNFVYSEVYGYIENINNLRHSDGNNRFVSAPTIAEVIMWLYKKHNIWISVEQNDKHIKTFHFKITKTVNISSSTTPFMTTAIFIEPNSYKSPIRAYIGGIICAVKKLL